MAPVIAPATEIVLYTRPGCHLCEDAHALLDALLAERTTAGQAMPPLVERNIDESDELQRRYGFVIPVVAVGDRELELVTSPAALRRFLAETLGDTTPHPARA
jgi:glutaredoxin